MIINNNNNNNNNNVDIQENDDVLTTNISKQVELLQEAILHKINTEIAQGTNNFPLITEVIDNCITKLIAGIDVNAPSKFGDALVSTSKYIIELILQFQCKLHDQTELPITLEAKKNFHRAAFNYWMQALNKLQNDNESLLFNPIGPINEKFEKAKKALSDLGVPTTSLDGEHKKALSYDTLKFKITFAIHIKKEINLHTKTINDFWNGKEIVNASKFSFEKKIGYAFYEVTELFKNYNISYPVINPHNNTHIVSKYYDICKFANTLNEVINKVSQPYEEKCVIVTTPSYSNAFSSLGRKYWDPEHKEYNPYD